MGTLINSVAILLGGLCGLCFGKLLKESVQQSLTSACGISVMFLGISGAMEGMLKTEGNLVVSQNGMMVVICLALGALLGELLDIEGGIEKFGEWLKRKTGNSGDAGFVGAFVTASLTVCIGAMAIVGSIEDGAAGNHSILFAKAVLDMIIIMVMAASLGKGCIFSAIPVGILQGTVTALAVLIRPYITDAAMNNLSLVGSVLIFCVGVNLFWGKKIRVANLLPSLIIAAAWAGFGFA